jgi:hypothetical protein
MKDDLDYCYDRGEQHINTANEKDLWRDRLQGIDKALYGVSQTLSADIQLKRRIAAASSKTFNGKPITHLQALRRAMAPNLVQEVLKQCVAYVEEAKREDVAKTIRSSFCKVFAILLNSDKAASIAEFIRLEINDSNLPLQGKSVKKSYGVYIKNNSFASIEGWEETEWQTFFNWQWHFLTPFFARPKGKVLHYLLESHDILPIIDRGVNKSNRKDSREDKSDLETGKPLQIKRSAAAFGGHGTVSKIKLDPLSCDFSDFQVRMINAPFSIPLAHNDSSNIETTGMH